MGWRERLSGWKWQKKFQLSEAREHLKGKAKQWYRQAPSTAKAQLKKTPSRIGRFAKAVKHRATRKICVLCRHEILKGERSYYLEGNWYHRDCYKDIKKLVKKKKRKGILGF